MVSHGLSTALTLYESGTLSLSHAASRAGLTEAAFLDQLERHGVEVADGERAAALDGDPTTARAD